MNLIDPSVELIDIEDPVVKIEKIGRICYKSNSDLSFISSRKFFRQLVERKHFAMLEHGCVTFKISGLNEGDLDPQLLSIPYLRWTFHNNNYYITASASHLYSPLAKWYRNIASMSYIIWRAMARLFEDCYMNTENPQSANHCVVSPNIEIRIIRPDEIENATYEDMLIHNTVTFRFVCDRGVSHELVRHRCSVAQESQRYCNYSKDKFGNEITYIKPYNYDDWSTSDKLTFVTALTNSEAAYQKLVKTLPPEQARGVLPNATKTEVVLTMPVYQWKHFISLRSEGSTGKPHPDMKVLADQVAQIMQIPEVPQITNIPESDTV